MSFFPQKDPIVHHTIQLRSRYSETDKMGYVYYGHYLQYFEVARTEFIRSTGISYKKMEDNGIMLPVINVELEYKTPVLYDELMDITVFMFEYPQVRFKTYYEVRTNNNRMPNVTGMVELCFVDRSTRRPTRAPEEFNSKIKQFAEQNI